MLGALLVCALAQAAASSFPVYPVHPLHEGVFPLDMDTADLAGDAFFDLRSKVLPIECSNSSGHHYSGDCSNQEVVDHDLVITKLTLTLRANHFGEYGRCNICSDKGVDPFSGLTCKPGAYLCSCGSYRKMRDCTNQSSVGAENITKSFGSFGHYSCTWSRWLKEPWGCWSWPVVGKTGGMWYSTTKAGWCGAPGADQSTCTWDAVVEKVVNKSCSDNVVHGLIESYDKKQGTGCFDACPYRHWHPFHPRNTSDTCWIYCFYSTLLGASNLLPSGGSAEEGMPREQVLDAFAKPFKPVAEGGCPDIKPSSTTSALRPGGATRRPWRTYQKIMNDMYRNAALATATVEPAGMLRAEAA